MTEPDDTRSSKPLPPASIGAGLALAVGVGLAIYNATDNLVASAVVGILLGMAVSRAHAAKREG